jgi:lipopolysaccharide transport system ATP-binding protein
MSFNEVAICVNNISKCYQIYDYPQDRLKQSVVPRLQRLLGRSPKQYFRRFWALKDASFEVRRGETVGIIGRNGSGKSTLLQMICGTLAPTQGTVSVNGRIAALLELGAGFNPEFTGRENVYMNGVVLGLSKGEIDNRFHDIVAFADIGEFIEQPVKMYSSGMFLRLAFAVIAHVDADVLIIDEALAVGDVFFTQKCMRYLREFTKRGTLLFVSHDTNSVMNLCDRAILLDKGELLAMGTAKDVCKKYLDEFYAARQSLEAKSEPSVDVELAVEGLSPDEEIDQRQSLINSCTLRNDIQVFKFEPEGDSFGKRGASIANVYLTDDRETGYYTWVKGGEKVKLVVLAEVSESIERAIIGFIVKDRLGQALFGDNTYLTTLDAPVRAERGQVVKAVFGFRMPIMPPGDYTISVAIADGTQESHVIHEWRHDVIAFRSVSSSVQTGLVGIPMSHISIQALAA